jgi:hypothetical protein
MLKLVLSCGPAAQQGTALSHAAPGGLVFLLLGGGLLAPARPPLPPLQKGLPTAVNNLSSEVACLFLFSFLPFFLISSSLSLSPFCPLYILFSPSVFPLSVFFPLYPSFLFFPYVFSPLTFLLSSSFLPFLSSFLPLSFPFSSFLPHSFSYISFRSLSFSIPFLFLTLSFLFLSSVILLLSFPSLSCLFPYPFLPFYFRFLSSFIFSFLFLSFFLSLFFLLLFPFSFSSLFIPPPFLFPIFPSSFLPFSPAKSTRLPLHHRKYIYKGLAKCSRLGNL